MKKRYQGAIYLVDDDQDDRMLIGEALKSTSDHVNVIEFSDGEQLLDQLENGLIRSEPSVILMDINMPRLNGLEALARIRSNKAISHIPVAIFSTSSNPKVISDAYLAGANAYLIKPVSVSGYNTIARAICLCYCPGSHDMLSGTQRVALQDKSVLVIEDNYDHWQLMKVGLKTLSTINLYHVCNATEAMNFLENHSSGTGRPVELIILDLYLPGRKQGLQLLSDIREFHSRNGMAQVPIIIFSSSDHYQDIQASYRSFASAYISKSTDLIKSALHLNDVCRIWSNTVAMPRSA
jgi:CheY-like chemotaxis protein